MFLNRINKQEGANMHLRQDRVFDSPDMKLLVIANPNAGRNKSPHFFDNIIEIFHQSGQSVTMK